MKVIFLDVDGVLNSEYSKSSCIDDQLGPIFGIDSDKVKRLAKIVEQTKAKIVLSSTWKHGWKKHYKQEDIIPSHVKYLIKHLRKKGRLRIYDVTPNIKNIYRGKEIKAWLDKHHPTHWVVLDDYLFDYDDEILDHLVKTDYTIGLTDEDVNKAIKILEG